MDHPVNLDDEQWQEEIRMDDEKWQVINKLLAAHKKMDEADENLKKVLETRKKLRKRLKQLEQLESKETS